MFDDSEKLFLNQDGQDREGYNFRIQICGKPGRKQWIIEVAVPSLMHWVNKINARTEYAFPLILAGRSSEKPNYPPGKLAGFVGVAVDL